MKSSITQLNDIKDCLYRVAVKAIVIKSNHVLLVQDKNDNGWCLPGGGVDHGEDLRTEETAVLEWIPINDLDNQVFDDSAGPKKELLSRMHNIVTLPT